VIEVDGWTHDDLEYDAARDAFMRGEGFTVLRVTNDDVRFHRDDVVREVLRAAGRL